jgi:hypothetical protein
MFKKVLLALSLTAFMSWAQDDFDDDDEGFVSAPAAASSEQEDDDDGFVSASDGGGSHAAMASSEDEEEDFSDAGMSAAQRREMAERKKFEEEQRLDEYANSERRRDWLRNRLIFQIGMGSRYPIMGETGMGMGIGAGLEYILPFHFALFGSYGFLPKGTDNDFDEWELEGGTGWKAGINYYLFPKNPLHLGLSVSYGTVYFDHDVKPNEDNIRPLIKVNGFQFDALITYLTNEWYFLQFSVGMYYAPELTKAKEESISYTFDKINKEYVSRVVNPDGMSKTGIVFGIMIGYALPELFPDDTEKRRREREKERERSSK